MSDKTLFLGYDACMTLAEAARRLKPMGVPRAILVTDDRRLPDPWVMLGLLAVGDGVLLRHYGDDCRAGLADHLAKACRVRRLALVVASDWRLAAKIGAAGLHLPEGLARQGCLAPALGWVRRRRALLTVAAHSPAALARARALGASAAILSPAFATASHPGGPSIGALRWRCWARRAGLPVVALGGVNARSVKQLGGRAAGIAAISGWHP